MSKYYDKERYPLTMWEWTKLFEDREYARIALTEKRGITVSTVWLGLDHGWGDGPPLIFETMIFGLQHEKYEYQERYFTMEQAVAGHEEACKIAFGWKSRILEALWPWRPDIPMPPIWKWKPPKSWAQPWDTEWEERWKEE